MQLRDDRLARESKRRSCVDDDSSSDYHVVRIQQSLCVPLHLSLMWLCHLQDTDEEEELMTKKEPDEEEHGEEAVKDGVSKL